jgi:hypothetical protein
MATIECVVCRAARDVPMARTGAPRTPKRWKVLEGLAYCGACKHRAYVLRAVTLPVAGPEGASWPAFREALREAWSEATRCANWLMCESYARDVRCAPATSSCKMPRIYLYPEARVLFPSLASQTVASLAQQVQAAYRSHRYELLWTGTRTLATYRYPAPYPIPSQAWSLVERDGRWHVMLRLGHQRWDLRLRGGPHTRYQIARLRQIATGDAEPGAATMYQVRVQRGSHRNGLPSSSGLTSGSAGGSAGGSGGLARVMLKSMRVTAATARLDGEQGSTRVPVETARQTRVKASGISAAAAAPPPR